MNRSVLREITFKVFNLLTRPLVTPALMSAFSTMLTRLVFCATASTAALTTAITSSHSPSMLVNIAFVWFRQPTCSDDFDSFPDQSSDILTDTERSNRKGDYHGLCPLAIELRVSLR